MTTRNTSRINKYSKLPNIVKEQFVSKLLETTKPQSWECLADTININRIQIDEIKMIVRMNSSEINPLIHVLSIYEDADRSILTLFKGLKKYDHKFLYF